jgi:hypothetical protein
MRALKNSICWVYAVQVILVLLLLSDLFRPRRQSLFADVRSSAVGLAGVCGLLLMVAAVFGIASWTMFKGKPSARFWIILPSLIYIGLAAVMAYQFPAHAGNAILPLAMGVAGPFVTWRRGGAEFSAAQLAMPKIAGDGTSNLLNKCGMGFAVVAYIGAWWCCNAWVARHHLPRAYGGLLVLFLVGFLNTLVHELGHTVIGLAFDMRLRAFVAGPFEFRKREGHWSFKFNPAGILTDGGATGVVPGSAQQPRGHQLAMIAAGPIFNLYCGILAMGFAYAFSAPGNANSNLVYPLALFGLYGLISFVVNLIPLRSGSNYSDGAKIVQLLSNGPWADMHRAFAVVSSSLVTPLEPRDYDIDAIQRASAGIRQGTIGVLLRLFAYSHYLDSGKRAEAAEALEDAEAVCKANAVSLPAELHTAFVFGNAFLRRDAAAARQWWEAMLIKKPARLNADYYRAESALHWIEGDIAQASIAWTKCEGLTQKLPQAGAYQFDRSLCTLLRQGIDGQPTDRSAAVGTQVDAILAPVPLNLCAALPLPPLDPFHNLNSMHDLPSPQKRLHPRLRLTGWLAQLEAGGLDQQLN